MMIYHFTLSQVKKVDKLCLECECWQPSNTPGFKTCKKYHTDSIVFLAERCEKVRQILDEQTQ